MMSCHHVTQIGHIFFSHIYFVIYSISRQKSGDKSSNSHLTHTQVSKCQFRPRQAQTSPETLHSKFIQKTCGLLPSKARILSTWLKAFIRFVRAVLCSGTKTQQHNLQDEVIWRQQVSSYFLHIERKWSSKWTDFLSSATSVVLSVYMHRCVYMYSYLYYIFVQYYFRIHIQLHI